MNPASVSGVHVQCPAAACGALPPGNATRPSVGRGNINIVCLDKYSAARRGSDDVCPVVLSQCDCE